MKSSKKVAKVGDIVHCRGKYEIEVILEQFYQERGTCEHGFFLEFIDTDGKYHYWKQYCDGGYLEKVS